MAFSDWEFLVDPPAAGDDGWWFAVRGRRAWRWGPYPDHHSALQAELAVFQRWNQAARARGGWAWKATPRRWVVTAPESVDVAGTPLVRAACTRHHASS